MEPLQGRLSATSRLPQYLTTAMFTGAVQVASTNSMAPGGIGSGRSSRVALSACRSRPRRRSLMSSGGLSSAASSSSWSSSSWSSSSWSSSACRVVLCVVRACVAKTSHHRISDQSPVNPPYIPVYRVSALIRRTDSAGAVRPAGCSMDRINGRSRGASKGDMPIGAASVFKALARGVCSSTPEACTLRQGFNRAPAPEANVEA